MEKANIYINKLKLKPHPEGGYFRETYRAENTISIECLPERFKTVRAFSTAIYFLLKGNQFSAFHRLKSDEIWHHYSGAPLNIYMIKTDGELKKEVLGKNILKGQQPQIVIKSNIWFAAKPQRTDSFSLIGCTVSPGFDFMDFELADRDRLIDKFPNNADLIKKLTRQ